MDCILSIEPGKGAPYLLVLRKDDDFDRLAFFHGLNSEGVGFFLFLGSASRRPREGRGGRQRVELLGSSTYLIGRKVGR